MMSAQFLTSMGNWSVSQPRSGEPVLESMEPSIPNLKGKTEKSLELVPETIST